VTLETLAKLNKAVTPARIEARESATPCKSLLQSVNTFKALELLNFDGLVRRSICCFIVIPAKAGIQSFQSVKICPDPNIWHMIWLKMLIQYLLTRYLPAINNEPSPP
jgi:hypothetical protein